MKNQLLCLSVAVGILLSASSALAFANPIVDRDMPDPDAATADGKTFYLVTSSFTDIPGLPIYKSEDLIHWKLVSHALMRKPSHAFWTSLGEGVWAPSMTIHEGKWHIFYGDPDYGIFTLTADDPEKEWSEQKLVMPGRGLIDPCPIWDDDGKLHIVHAFAASRAGFNSVLAIDGRIVYDGSLDGNHTVEGPKIYKRNGWYWIFAPAGGVATGWQLAMRSKNLYGPYECRKVLEQGDTPCNGPHQGAWVTKADGTDWFLHFQDKGYLGRVLWLEPMRWSEDEWPVMGENGVPYLGEGTPPELDLTPDWSRSGDVFTLPDGATRLYSGAMITTKFPKAEFEVSFHVTAWQKEDNEAPFYFGVFGEEEWLIPFEVKKGKLVELGAADAVVCEIDVALKVSKGGESVLTVGDKTKKFVAKKSIWQAAKYGFKVPRIDNAKTISSFSKARTGRKPWANWIDIK